MAHMRGYIIAKRKKTDLKVMEKKRAILGTRYHSVRE
jgi:hypothetical protein